MVATRRSRGIEVKVETPSKLQPIQNKSSRKNPVADNVGSSHSARIRQSSPCGSRQNRANRIEDSEEYGLRRSLRRRTSNFASLNEKYIGFEPVADKKLRRGRARDGESPISDRTKRRKCELSDLLAAQGKNLSDAKLYTEPDIYSSVKSRVRVSTRDRLYEQYFTQGMSKKKPPEVEEESQSEETEEDEDEDDQTNEEDDDDDDEDDVEERHPYKLRKVREAPKRYMIVREVQRRRPRSLFEDLPCSPARRRRRRPPGTPSQVPFRSRRRRARTQGNSSTSDDSSSDDEMKFRKRQQKSMTRARHECMPINLSSADLNKHSYTRERKRLGLSLTDIDPMGLDTSISFSSIGGHYRHIRSLKEMVVFPLLYPEVFNKFDITPPRGCLFYGPPGTGKTLMARALANECSTGGKRVSFFMKKGADCLSKWIGESERQLRILFDQAYQMRPSIIFFDEIDGLAPVRSSRQDQIHSSIVSTLLALMDGLDSRGEVIVIGATNRIDSIDPALRRPGRFDREFLFPLPNKQAREEILRIHTKTWNPQLKQSFVQHLASKTIGYCGADMKALCTEATLNALRRRYPQIYESSEKLQLDVSSISIQADDFHVAVKSIIPTAQRSTSSTGRALPAALIPLLGDCLRNAVFQLVKVFPALKKRSKVIETADGILDERQSSRSRLVDEEDWNAGGHVGGIYVGESNFQEPSNPISSLLSRNDNGIVRSRYSALLNALMSTDQSLITVHRPRFLICGESLTINSHLTPAMLHDMEGLPVHCLDLPSLYGVSARTPEESCAQVFREARRLTPSVIYLPDALQWWFVASPTVQATLQYLLQDIPSNCPVLFLATANSSYRQLPREFAKFFHSDFDEVLEIEVNFTSEQRRKFFAPVFLFHSVIPPPRNNNPAMLVKLPVAPAPEPAPLTKEEENRLLKEEESTLRNLRLFLRDVLMRLERDRRFKIFSKPVDDEEVPDYTEVIKNPMDFSTMQTKIDQHKYQTAEMFLSDIDLICDNALEYNPDRRPEDKLIRHRACAMRDMAHAIVGTDLDPEFDKLCHDAVSSRNRRGTAINKFAPKFYPVLPEHLMVHPITGEITPKSVLQTQDLSLDNSHVQRSGEKTPWKSQSKKLQSATKVRRKRSSWSRGILSSARKKKRAVQCSEDEEDKIEIVSEKSREITDGDISEGSDDPDSKDKQNNVVEEEDDAVSSRYESIAERRNTSVSFENGTGTEVEIDIDPDSGKDSLPCPEEIVEDNEKSFTVTNGYALDNICQEEGNETEAGEGKDSEESHSNESDLQNGEVPDSPSISQLTGNEEFPSPPKRMTLRNRRRSNSETLPAVEKVAEPPPPPLLVDHESLIELLENVVSITESYTLNELERIHVLLSRCVAKYKLKYDRTLLIKDLKMEIQSISSSTEGSPPVS